MVGYLDTACNVVRQRCPWWGSCGTAGDGIGNHKSDTGPNKTRIYSIRVLADTYTFKSHTTCCVKQLARLVEVVDRSSLQAPLLHSTRVGRLTRTNNL
jgi:hypothetical protein